MKKKTLLVSIFLLSFFGLKKTTTSNMYLKKATTALKKASSELPDFPIFYNNIIKQIIIRIGGMIGKTYLDFQLRKNSHVFIYQGLSKSIFFVQFCMTTCLFLLALRKTWVLLVLRPNYGFLFPEWYFFIHRIKPLEKILNVSMNVLETL